MPAPDPESFRRAMSAVPTAVTVITAADDSGPLGATANAVVSLSISPPLMLVALDRRSRTLEAAQRSGRFGISVLAAEQADLAPRFATKDPHAVKWEGVAWRELDGVPALEGATLAMACELREELDGGDHAILTGAVGTLVEDDGAPLVFYAGAYRPLTP